MKAVPDPFLFSRSKLTECLSFDRRHLADVITEKNNSLTNDYVCCQRLCWLGKTLFFFQGTDLELLLDVVGRAGACVPIYETGLDNRLEMLAISGRLELSTRTLKIGEYFGVSHNLLHKKWNACRD